MAQLRFLNNGKVVNETLLTKAVGLRFHEASETLEVGQTVTVEPVEVTGFHNVLGVFNSSGQVGNIISNKGFEEEIFESHGGRVFTNIDLVKDFKDLHFTVKSVNKLGAVLTASFNN